MKVLITSGGTVVKIDAVRKISNMSRGTFGSKIADAFYNSTAFCTDTSGVKECNCDIKFMMAKHSKIPTYPEINCITYETFDDYADMLFRQLELFTPDIIVLAAAVSDYGVENYVDGKIRTTDDLVIRLKPLPKLISMVRGLAPKAVICGFKLLVNSTDDELKQACMDSLIKNDLDIIVGNDLRDIKAGNHRLLLYNKTGIDNKIDYNEYTSEQYDLAQIVAAECLYRFFER